MADGLTDYAMNVGAVAIGAKLTHIQLHDGDPGAAGTANVIAGIPRGAVTFTVDADGLMHLSVPEAFTGDPAQPVTHATLWDALTSGNHTGTKTLTGDQAFNASGEYEVETFTWTPQTS